MRGRGEIGRRWRLKIFCPWRAGSSPAVRTIAAGLLLTAAACDRRADVGPVIVSAIGTTPEAVPQLIDASRGPRSMADRLLADSIAQGLVRFDAAGQVEPGLAERWIVTDEGRSYIFRLRDATWTDGRPIKAGDIVAILKRQIAPASRNPLAPYLTAIDSIVEMTPQVIQIELARPRPDLLRLFAQPEMTLTRMRPPGGSGPFRVLREGKRSTRLTPLADPDRAADEQRAPVSEDDVRLIAERAARAIVRFAARQSDYVAGGTAIDWPLVAQSDVAAVNTRIDPAAGLFGLAITNRDGFLAAPENRAALAQAIDRAALTGVIATGWAPAEQILPDQLDSAATPAIASWSTGDLAARRAAARAQVAAWRATHPDPIVLRIALPDGPGANLIWGQIAADFIAIGIQPARVAPGAATDLRLIDAVAPYDSARWYLASACAPCGEEAAAAVESARIAPTLAERATAIAAADTAVTADIAFIPIARPYRWSLVSLRLRDWQPNPRAWHPLNHLRRDTN